MKAVRKIQILITLIAIGIAIVHILWPSLKIDAVTLTLIIIAVVPWLAPLFKSVELPTGFKLEFREELESVEKKAEAVGLIDNKVPIDPNKYTFLKTADSDPELTLTYLRSELIKSLIGLARQEDVIIKYRAKGHVTSLVQDLYQKRVILSEERDVLFDIFRIVNGIIYGEKIENCLMQRAINIGSQILNSINKRLKMSSNTG